jgi:hypothetical protein
MKKTPVRLGSCRCVCSLHCLLWIGGLVYYWPPKISGRHTFNELRAGFTPGPLTFLLPARGLFCYPGPHTINELGGCFGARPSKIYAAFMPSLSATTTFDRLGGDSGTTAYRLGTLPVKLASSLHLWIGGSVCYWRPHFPSTGQPVVLLPAGDDSRAVNTIDRIGGGFAARPLRFLRALITILRLGGCFTPGPLTFFHGLGPPFVARPGHYTEFVVCVPTDTPGRRPSHYHLPSRPSICRSCLSIGQADPGRLQGQPARPPICTCCPPNGQPGPPGRGDGALPAWMVSLGGISSRGPAQEPTRALWQPGD